MHSSAGSGTGEGAASGDDIPILVMRCYRDRKEAPSPPCWLRRFGWAVMPRKQAPLRLAAEEQ